MSKQHPFACIPKSRKTSCSLALLICPSILLVHIGINIRLGVYIGIAKHRLTIRFGDQTRKGLLRGSIRSREGGQLVGRVQGRRTTGGQGPGNADNWRAESRAGGQLAGKNRRQTKVGGRLAGRVQGRRTIGGQGPGKADNWRARSREGGQLVGRVQGKRTTGGQGPGKTRKRTGMTSLGSPGLSSQSVSGFFGQKGLGKPPNGLG